MMLGSLDFLGVVNYLFGIVLYRQIRYEVFHRR